MKEDPEARAEIAPPPRPEEPASVPPTPSQIPSVLFPRGKIAPLLEDHAPVWKRLARMMVRLLQGLYHFDAFDVAPAMAFHFFLSLLPLLVFLGYVVAIVAQRAGVETVLWPLLDRLPESSDAMVKREVARLANASTLGPVAAVSFLWIAAGGTHGLMNALELAVGAPRRPWWKKRLLALGWVVGSFVILVGLSVGLIAWDTWVTPPEIPVVDGTAAATAVPPPSPASFKAPTVDSNATATDAPPPDEKGHEEAQAEATPPKRTTSPRRWTMLRHGGERVFMLVLTFVLTTLVLAAFYRFSISRPERVKRRVVPGAVLAVTLGLLITWGFGVYVRSLAGYAVFYGSLAAVVVMLVWLWLTSFAILVGAELNAQLEGLRD